MEDIVITGGAKIGMANVSWPFAKLTVNKNVLQLNASIIGNLYFRPSDVISIEPSSLFAGPGIKINHRVEKYKSKVIFLTPRGKELFRRIEATGFLNNKDILPADLEDEILVYQSGGVFPIKLSATIAFIVIWNVSILADWFGYSGSSSRIPIGNGARFALAFAFLFALTLLISAPFRKMVLKQGRVLKDVKSFLIFLMLITFFMFLAFSFILE